VSIDSFGDFETKNASLIQSARVNQTTYLQQSATLFLPELHSELCKRVLDIVRAAIAVRWETISNASMAGSLFVTRRAALDQELANDLESLKRNLGLLQQILRRSFLWGTDVSEREIESFYVSLRLNRNLLVELFGILAVLKLSLPGYTFDTDQFLWTLKVTAGRQILVIHCRGASAVTVRDEIICRLMDSQGPLTPGNILLVLLNTDATGDDISKLPPRRRTRATGNPSSRVTGLSDVPASWRVTTSGDTINRAPFISVNEWDVTMQELVA
jgi:hypothetical protein